MKRLLVYLKDYKKESILGPLFKLLEASFELFVPLVMAAIIDKGIADGNKQRITSSHCIRFAAAQLRLISTHCLNSSHNSIAVGLLSSA